MLVEVELIRPIEVDGQELKSVVIDPTQMSTEMMLNHQQQGTDAIKTFCWICECTQLAEHDIKKMLPSDYRRVATAVGAFHNPCGLVREVMLIIASHTHWSFTDLKAMTPKGTGILGGRFSRLTAESRYASRKEFGFTEEARLKIESLRVDGSLLFERFDFLGQRFDFLFLLAYE